MDEPQNPESTRDENPPQDNNWNLFLYLGAAVIAVFVLYQVYAGNKDYRSKLESGVPPDLDLNMQPVVADDKNTNEKIALIRIYGPIGMNNSLPTEVTVSKLRMASANPEIKGILLEIVSPGGVVNDSDIIWREVMKIRSSTKPVVAFFNGFATSAAYHIATPANKIVATPATLTGSIGAIWMSYNVSGLSEKIGVKAVVIKSGSQKDMLSPFRPNTPEELKIAQDLIDESYENFVAAVAKGRKMNLAKVRNLADGRIYSARQAVANGLIDKIGYFEDAVDLVKKLAKSKKANVVEIQEKMPPLGMLFQKTNHITPQWENIVPKPGLYYLPPVFMLNPDFNN